MCIYFHIVSASFFKALGGQPPSLLEMCTEFVCARKSAALLLTSLRRQCYISGMAPGGGTCGSVAMLCNMDFV